MCLSECCKSRSDVTHDSLVRSGGVGDVPAARAPHGREKQVQARETDVGVCPGASNPQCLLLAVMITVYEIKS